eukprot:422512-Pyramimonas_sp.AAC.1
MCFVEVRARRYTWTHSKRACRLRLPPPPVDQLSAARPPPVLYRAVASRPGCARARPPLPSPPCPCPTTGHCL